MQKRNIKAAFFRFLLNGSYRSLLKTARNPGKVNTRVLKDILRRNRKTQIGRKYAFGKIETPADYRRQVPVSQYDDYEDSISKMAAGEKNILTADALRAFGLTSGTTGKAKLLPVTRRGRYSMLKIFGPLAYTMVTHFPGVLARGKGVFVGNSSQPGSTARGVPVGAISTIGNQRMGHFQSRFATSPFEVSRIQDYRQALYLHLLFALKEPQLRYIGAIFASSIFDFFLCLEQNWPRLLADLETGRLDPELKLSPAVRKKLERQLRASPGRIKQLRQELEQGVDNIACRIWPGLICLISIFTGPFSIYKNRLKIFSGDLPAFSPLYAATEGMLGINLEPALDYFTIIPGTMFYEFIPVGHVAEQPGRTLLMEELEPGKEYEVVITSYSGLYRYRLGDIIRVVKYFHKLPVIEFIRRKGTLLNIAAEKTSTDAVMKALERLAERGSQKIIDFTTFSFIDASPGFYQFFIEFSREHLATSELEALAVILDATLSETNPRYGVARAHNKLARVQIRPLEKGTFAAFKDERIRQGASANQVKIPRVIKTDDRLSYFEARVCSPGHAELGV